MYIVIPPSVKHTKFNIVCKLVKSLYGLKQTSRKRHEILTSFLIKHQHKQATTNVSLFIKQDKKSFTIMLVYVDDIILADNSL